MARFPWWILVASAAIAAGYLPTLQTPFDFIDDGNLVHPAPAETTDFAGVWWKKVRANYDHLGPFRPTLWLHWELFANLFGGSAPVWRIERLLWCSLATGMLLWLLHELRIPRWPAIIATAAAMWNPYRNEIWTSLTLAEGVAMPYALLALVAARKGATFAFAWRWDLLAIVGLIVALGCKNVFVGLIPPMLLLRIWPDGVSFGEAWRRNGLRSMVLAIPIALPIAHYVYFKRHWHPGQYETHSPSIEQTVRILRSLKGAMTADFLTLGYAATATLTVWKYGRNNAISPRFAAAILLLASGIVVYLPMDMMSGRYSMPAVWGLDILFAILLTRFVAIPASVGTRLCGIVLALGLSITFIANLGRQDKFTARAEMLWQVVHRIESTAPQGATIAWHSGDALHGGLDREEGIHVLWHLQARGRTDLKMAILDAEGNRIRRPELDSSAGEADIHVQKAGEVRTHGKTWQSESSYWFGQKRFTCDVASR